MNAFTQNLMLVLASCALVLVSPAAMAGKKKANDNEWYIKMVLVVEDGSELSYDDRSGVFGRFKEAKTKLDRHDIPVFQAVNGSRAAIAFSVPGAENQQFLSNYQAPGSQRRTWEFSVYSSLSSGEATLYWHGPYDLSGAQPVLNPASSVLKALWLVDLETGEVIDASSGSYTFNLEGKTQRNFRWVQNRINKGDLKLEPAAYPEISIQARRAGVDAQTGRGNFGIPPAIGTDAVQAPAPPTVLGQEIILQD